MQKLVTLWVQECHHNGGDMYTFDTGEYAICEHLQEYLENGWSVKQIVPLSLTHTNSDRALGCLSVLLEK